MQKVVHGNIKVIHFDYVSGNVTSESKPETGIKAAKFMRTDTFEVAGFTLRWTYRISGDALSYIAEDEYHVPLLADLTFNEFREIIGTSQRKLISEFDSIKKDKGIEWSILASVSHEQVRELFHNLQTQF